MISGGQNNHACEIRWGIEIGLPEILRRFSYWSNKWSEELSWRRLGYARLSSGMFEAQIYYRKTKWYGRKRWKFGHEYARLTDENIKTVERASFIFPRLISRMALENPETKSSFSAIAAAGTAAIIAKTKKRRRGKKK